MNWFHKALLLLTCLLFSLSGLLAQVPSTCLQAYQLVKTAEKFHFSLRPVNDEFSELVFTEFLTSIDYASVFFTGADIESLSSFRKQIDDEILNQRCVFIDKVKELYVKKLTEASTIVNAMEKKKLNFAASDTLTISRKDVHMKPADLGRRWEQLTKFQVLSAYIANADSIDVLPMPSADTIEAIREKVTERNKCRISSRLNYDNGIEAYLGDKFLKAVAHAFDPHTEYFGSPEKNEFESTLSKESKGYGFEFEDNESGEMEIVAIVPGSPAWNSNALNEGDVIVSVEPTGRATKDFSCIGTEEAYRYLNDADLNEAYFEFRKKNGKNIRLKLFKDRIDVEQNIIQSFILEGKRRAGYIYLPSFYTEMSSDSDLPNGCANDLAKEVIKLKKEGIEGLIFDLRDNGGGSMLEAIRVAGIFINFGAVGIVTYRDGVPETLKDIDRGTVYDDPLLILMNKFSASASELFAAAMQDYQRGIIAGSASFGKSTAQDIIPLDAYRFSTPDVYEGEAQAYLKLTEGAFFRVTGETHQKKGVQPDIRLPDPYDRVDMGESRFSTALEFPKIDKKTYYYPLEPLPLEKLREASTQRTRSNQAFKQIIEERKKEQENDNLVHVPLEYNTFKSFISALYPTANETDSSEKNVFFVKNPSYMKDIGSANEAKKEINENAMKEIKNDIYITESFHILNDLLQFTNH